MNATVRLWVRSTRTLLSAPPAGHHLVVVDGRLVLVPTDLLDHDPRGLTTEQRANVHEIAEVGAAEVA